MRPIPSSSQARSTAGQERRFHFRSALVLNGEAVKVSSRGSPRSSAHGCMQSFHGTTQWCRKVRATCENLHHCVVRQVLVRLGCVGAASRRPTALRHRGFAVGKPSERDLRPEFVCLCMTKRRDAASLPRPSKTRRSMSERIASAFRRGHDRGSRDREVHP
jgi:hypothetical protein